MTFPADIMISIVIVNWNTRDHLRTALRSIQTFAPAAAFRVVVVDNGSADGSAAMVRTEFPQTILIPEKVNHGFARAVNLGINKVPAKYYLLLNSDCEFIESIVDQMIAFMESHGTVGLLGPAVVYPEGSLQSAGEPALTTWSIFKSQILFAKSPLRMRRKKWPENEFREVGFISGSCLLIRHDLFKSIGSLREDFFMYGEDVDYCLRARQDGWKVGVLPHLRVRHYKAKSTRQNLSATLKNSILNNCRLIAETSGRIHALLCLLFYAVGAALRGIVALLTLKSNACEWFRLVLFAPGLAVQLLTQKK